MSTAARVAIVAGTIGMASTACGNQDEATFGGPTDAATALAETMPSETTLVDEAPPGSAATSATLPAPAESENDQPDPAATTTLAAAGVAFSDGAELVVDFTFLPDSTERAQNPYVAVWVEDPSGNMVQTISLWFEQSGKGARWLNELRRWSSAGDGKVDAASSGATRDAASYSVAWDGTSLDGEKVSEGDYVIFVEAAREHGPYEATSSPVAFDGHSFSASLPDDGELSALSVSFLPGSTGS